MSVAEVPNQDPTPPHILTPTSSASRQGRSYAATFSRLTKIHNSKRLSTSSSGGSLSLEGQRAFLWFAVKNAHARTHLCPARGPSKALCSRAPGGGGEVGQAVRSVSVLRLSLPLAAAPSFCHRSLAPLPSPSPQQTSCIPNSVSTSASQGTQLTRCS